ncbi:hypothetical protein D915_005220 [Fasciola hepatica]|uniref:Terminal uridylyltransferase 4/7 nucleotidyltransferase domain-containing protein n=1 Tax=Fasciola hepatica TaxID=6192 RepID=A0A4E0RBV0_FASHE|nr:hypothetical protein D915_005220 [Fasciola hepatica]
MNDFPQDVPFPQTQNRRKPKKRRSDAPYGSDGVDTSIPVETLAHMNENQIYLRAGQSKQTAHIVSVLLHLPPITDAHRLVLNQTLETASQGVLIGNEELKRRQQFADHLVRWLEHCLPDLKLSRTGSTWTGLALIDSDVNLDVSYQSTTSNDQSEHTVTRITSQKSLPQTLVSDSTVERGPGLGYLLMRLFNLLKTHASVDLPKPSNTTTIPSPDTEITGNVKGNAETRLDVTPEIYW